MYDKIILIDSYYPFGKGENFLANEIKYMINAAERIYVFPIYADDFKNNKANKYDKVISMPIKQGEYINTKIIIQMILNRNVYNEIGKAIYQKKFSAHILKNILYSYMHAQYCFNKIVKLLKKEIKKEDKLLFYSYWMHEQSYVAIKLKKFFGGECITRCHGYDLYEYRADKGFLPFRKDVLKYNDKIYSISEDGKNYLISKYKNIICNKIIVSYLGTEHYGINPDVGKDDFIIVSCSNLIPVKRVELIIKTLSIITEYKISWVHYGGGSEMEKLMHLAENNLPSNIEWEFKGYLSNDAIMKQYQEQHIDLFINVSESEGLPVSIMEAISFGIPVIATDVGGTAEIVYDGVNGFIIDKEFKIEDLKKIIIGYKTLEQSQKKEMRENARKVWENKFDAKNNYNKFYNEINNMI